MYLFLPTHFFNKTQNGYVTDHFEPKNVVSELWDDIANIYYEFSCYQIDWF